LTRVQQQVPKQLQDVETIVQGFQKSLAIEIGKDDLENLLKVMSMSLREICMIRESSN